MEMEQVETKSFDVRWKGGVVGCISYDAETRGQTVLEHATKILQTLKTLQPGDYAALKCFGTPIEADNLVADIIETRWQKMCSKSDIAKHANVWVDLFTENPQQELNQIRDQKREHQAFRQGDKGGISIVVNQFFDPQKTILYADLNDTVEDLLFQIQKVLKHSVSETYLTLGLRRLDPSKTLGQEKCVEGCQIWINRNRRTRTTELS